jgi:transketolase
MTKLTPDSLAVNTIRGLSMDAVQAANSGHPGTPMALAPLGWLLFSKLRKHDPQAPGWVDRDRFVLSCGHASMLQYALLHLAGYDVSLEDIKNFRQWGSKTPGHPEYGHTPGVEITTGPLGQGLATAVGMAMAERHLAARFNTPSHELIDHVTWVIASDGDIQEGVASEASSIAGRLGLGKLVVFWDDNDITIDGRTSLSMTEDVLARYRSYGWHVQSVDDGEDLTALEDAAKAALADPRPSFVRVKTVIGFPAPSKKDTSGAHGAPLGVAEIEATKKVMGWPLEPFHVPSDLAAVTTEIVARGRASREAWERKLEAYKKDEPAKAAELEVALGTGLPDGWDRDLPEFPADAKGIATRKAGHTVLNAIAKAVPGLVGGSADLACSNLTNMDGFAAFLPESEGVPRNVAWGIREHGMAAAVNGMALHGGVIPFGATFLIFSDYMRPALRLAALMKVKTRYVFTHDSIGLGEDGPTHQPIEQLAILRAIPGFEVLRPADANETRECWKLALEADGPAALVLTRQNLPTLDRTVFASAAGVRRGGYVLRDAEGGSPEVILVATGSEVSLAIEAQDALASKGVRARVVSLPSFARFLAQDAAYRESVLPKAVRARVGVEAGIEMGWERLLGDEGRFIGMSTFGASAPAEILFEKFGITSAAVAAAAMECLRRS